MSAMKLLLLAAVAPITVHAGTVRHRQFAEWTPRHEHPAQDLRDLLHLAENATVQASFCEGAAAEDFPCRPDFRNPNDAWTLPEKILFVGIYATFWVFVCSIVHLWQSISARLERKPAKNGAASLGKPLLEGEETETPVGPTPPYPSDKRVVELFEERVKDSPNNVALIVPGVGNNATKEITYAELNQAAEEVAEALLSVGITVGSVVALVLDRSVAQVVAVFGVLKSGAAFVPIDADAPLARKQFLVSESDAAVVIGAIGNEEVAELAESVSSRPHFISLPVDGALETMKMKLPRSTSCHLTRTTSGAQLTRNTSNLGIGEPVERKRPKADDMALLIYTSGTTGQPKGIVYDHSHLMHGVYFFGWQCEMSSKSVALLKSPYFWAIIEWEMFPALTLGAKMVVASATGHKSPEYLANMIREHEVSTLMITPQVLDLVLDIHEAQRGVRPLRSLNHIVTVGEPLTCALANRTVQMLPQVGMHNFYGASESSCTVFTVPKEGIDLSVFPSKAPAGCPQPHSKVYVMRAEEPPTTDGGVPPPATLTPVPAGAQGEICFGGVLAACYWKHDELTAQKWIDTAQYGRLYRTGDIGRWRAGHLEIVGRADRQVKVRGVRVEPEEVEAVLKKYMVASESTDAEEGLGSTMRAALRDVAVVASAEPSELVACVTKRDGVKAITEDGLRAHCQANLTPSYMPKYFMIMDEMPKLPNGKNDLKELVKVATAYVADAGEVAMDSLGQMKKLSKWAMFENHVIHRCYAFWMLGVLTDHYMRCAIDSNSDGSFAAFCTILARKSVKPWTEILVRSFFGNDQDMFGFIMLGAYQDARPEKDNGPPRVKLGLKDVFVFMVYLMMALPLPQLMHMIFGSWAWPVFWSGGNEAPQDEWGWDYMRLNSDTSDHRWYLLMILQTRIFLQIGEVIGVPGWAQVIFYGATCAIPMQGSGYLFDFCQNRDQQPYALYVFSWVFRNWGNGCPMVLRWVQIYGFFYVLCFHFLRPLVAFITKRIPERCRTNTWAAGAFSTSQMIGLSMALFHYPNLVLESGTGVQWAWLEMSVAFLQPALIALGMSALPFNLAWWGNTTLGCYVFHFYFKDQVGMWVWSLCDWVTWDPTGLLAFFLIIGLCAIFTTFLGPAGHYFLLTPTLLYPRIVKAMAARPKAAVGAGTRPRSSPFAIAVGALRGCIEIVVGGSGNGKKQSKV